MAEYTVKEKMEHAIAEAAASFMTNEYVVKGAQLKCTLGSAPSLLNLPLCHGFYATGHPIIHSMDNKPMVNILPFGTCPVLGGPCVPAPVGPWLNTHDKTMIADAAPGGPLYPAVTMKSFLVCALGGLIEPKKSGQEYKAPGASSTLDGKIPANTGRYEDASSKEPAGTLFTSDDWAFYGRDGNLFEPNPDLNKEFGVFGGPIEYEWGTQAEIDLSLVDRIARTLFHEAETEEEIVGIAYTMFNRVYLNNTWLYLGGKEQSLYNSLTAGAEGYGTFLHKYNVGLGTESKPDPNNNPSGRPDPFDIKGYIEKYKHITPDLEERWEFSLQLAKVMVSICGNQTMTVEEKRNKFKQLAPSPFPEKINGEEVDIDRIVEYATDGHNGRFIHKTEWVHYFGYTPGDKDLNEQNWNVG